MALHVPLQGVGRKLTYQFGKYERGNPLGRIFAIGEDCRRIFPFIEPALSPGTLLLKQLHPEYLSGGEDL